MLDTLSVIEVPEARVPPGTEGGIAYIGGEFVPTSEAKLSIFDFGFVHCDATYDVAHVWDGMFFRLEDHVDRFLASVAGCRLTLPVGREGLIDLLHECVRRSGLTESYVDMIVTRGVPPAGTRDLRKCVNHTLILFASPYLWVLPREKVRTGAHLVVSSVPRIPKESVNPRFKNFHWGDFNQALFEAYDKGGDTAVLPDRDGNITEGPGFNVFLLRDGAVLTPPDNVLEGITRRTVGELCAELGLDFREEHFKADDLHNADEVFISSTAGGIYPITRVDGRVLGNDVPGPNTVRLGNLYWRKKRAGWHGTPVR